MGDAAFKVVYIEDNQANRDLVIRVLEATGRYRVFGAPDGATGLDIIERELPALVLVDLDVPGVNGFEVTRQVKASARPEVARIPVAAVSANVLKNERLASLEAGCVAFIEKPFDINVFRKEVARLIGAEE